MLDIRSMNQIKNYIDKNHDVILPHSVTWTATAAKTLKSDGSFSDGSDTDTTIKAQIEPIRSLSQEQYMMVQGYAEDSTHVLFTLNNYSISEQDTITFSGKTYRVKYVFTEQYDLALTECLLKVEG